MGKTLSSLRCPGCIGPLTMAHRPGGGAKCRKSGCPVTKVGHDAAGNIIWILYSSEAKSAPISPDQLRIMNEVIIA